MQTAYNIIAYKDKPRLRTAVEMLKTTQEIEHGLEDVCSFLTSLCYIYQKVELTVPLSSTSA